MSAPTSQQPLPPPNGAALPTLLQEFQAKQDRLEQTVRDLREQLAAVEKERDHLQKDCETYRKGLHYMMEKYEPVQFSLTREEMDEMEHNGLKIEDVLMELERP